MRTPLPSFRDPGGRTLVGEDRVVRFLTDDAWQTLNAFGQSAAAIDLIADGRLPAWHELPRGDALGAATTSGLDDNWQAAVTQDRIAFPSYPHEWPAAMLAAAGECILTIHLRLLADGYGLKDATPYNILFQAGRPVHVDILSVEQRPVGDPLWRAEAQLIRTVVLPLLAETAFGLPTHTSFFDSRDGLTPDALYGLSSPLRRLMSPFFGLVSLPVWLSRKAEDMHGRLYAPKQIDAARARFTLETRAQRLTKHVNSLSAARRVPGWSDYEDAHGYSDAEVQLKEDFVTGALRDHKPKRVLDLGCNTGRYSVLAAEAGASVVAVDAEPEVVGRLWSKVAARQLDILPLVGDIARPVPALGWRNGECLSFLDRAEGHFDLVMALALVHHLLVSERVPVNDIIDLLADLTTTHALVEYVAPEDPYFQRICRGREDLFADFNVDVFEASLKRRFEIVDRRPLKDGLRVIYNLTRKPT